MRNRLGREKSGEEPSRVCTRAQKGYVGPGGIVQEVSPGMVGKHLPKNSPADYRKKKGPPEKNKRRRGKREMRERV